MISDVPRFKVFVASLALRVEECQPDIVKRGKGN